VQPYADRRSFAQRLRREQQDAVKPQTMTRADGGDADASHADTVLASATAGEQEGKGLDRARRE